MAKCNLDIDEPKLVVHGNVSNVALRGGLTKLRDKVAQDHTASMWFAHPMKGFQQFAKKVWEWDFKPAGDRSSTRPGWRVLAYVPNPHGPEPILARPFVCWDKAQAPKKNAVPFIAEALKKFLSETVRIEPEEEVFRRVVDAEGKNIAVCQICWDRVESFDLTELEIMEDAHKQDCRGKPPG